jgi:hypothetical protein
MLPASAMRTMAVEVGCVREPGQLRSNSRRAPSPHLHGTRCHGTLWPLQVKPGDMDIEPSLKVWTLAHPHFHIHVPASPAGRKPNFWNTKGSDRRVTRGQGLGVGIRARSTPRLAMLAPLPFLFSVSLGLQELGWAQRLSAGRGPPAHESADSCYSPVRCVDPSCCRTRMAAA